VHSRMVGACIRRGCGWVHGILNSSTNQVIYAGEGDTRFQRGDIVRTDYVAYLDGYPGPPVPHGRPWPPERRAAAAVRDHARHPSHGHRPLPARRSRERGLRGRRQHLRQARSHLHGLARGALGGRLVPSAGAGRSRSKRAWCSRSSRTASTGTSRISWSFASMDPSSCRTSSSIEEIFTIE
jgi:hypothetical protein